MTKNVSFLLVALLLAATPKVSTLAADAPRMKGIGWVVIRSHDRDLLEAFYRALGFQEWASSEKIIGLRAGGGAAIELGRLDPDAPKNPPRTSREQAPAMAIFGTDNVAEVVARAEAERRDVHRTLRQPRRYAAGLHRRSRRQRHRLCRGRPHVGEYGRIGNSRHYAHT